MLTITMRQCTGICVALVVLMVGGALKAGTLDFGVRWRGTMHVLPETALGGTRLWLTTLFEGWTARLELDTRGTELRDALGVLRGQLQGSQVEGRAAFAPSPRQLLSLRRTWQGQVYPQVLWETPAPHLRYAWIRSEVPVGDGAFSLRLHHRVHHGWDVMSLRVADVIRWDASAQAWRIDDRELATARRRAFVARGLRVIRADGGTYTDRFSLAMAFDPTNREQPFSPAPEAQSYLDARVDPGWTLDEVFFEEALVYLQRPYRTELRLRWDIDLSFGDLRLTTFWEDKGIGLAWWKTEGRLRGIHLARGAGGSLAWSMGAHEPLAASGEVNDWHLWGPWSGRATVSWCVRGATLELALDWDQEEGHVTAHVRPLWEGHPGTLWPEGVSVACEFDNAWTADMTVAFARPPAPRPAWYRNAAFRRVHGTAHWEDGRWALSVDRGGFVAECVVYTATAAQGLRAITRVLVQLDVRILDFIELEISWVSDDPSMEEGLPGLEVAWDLTV